MDVNLLVLVLWLGLGFATAHIARDKGYDYTSWFFFGMLLGVVALIIIGVKRPMTKKPS